MNHAEKVKELVAEYASATELAYSYLSGPGERRGADEAKEELHAAIDEMQAEIERLREALIAYATTSNWRQDNCGVLRVWCEPGSSTPDAYDGFTLATKAMAELQKESQDQFATHIQPSLPPLPEGAGDYFLDGGRWVRCNDPSPQARGDGV